MAPEPERWAISLAGSVSRWTEPDPETAMSADRLGDSLAEPLPERWASTS